MKSLLMASSFSLAWTFLQWCQKDVLVQGVLIQCTSLYWQSYDSKPISFTEGSGLLYALLMLSRMRMVDKHCQATNLTYLNLENFFSPSDEENLNEEVN